MDKKPLLLSLFLLVLMGQSCGRGDKQTTIIPTCKDINLFTASSNAPATDDDDGDASASPSSVDGTGDTLDGPVTVTICGDSLKIDDNQIEDVEIRPELGLSRRHQSAISIEEGTVHYIELRR